MTFYIQSISRIENNNVVLKGAYYHGNARSYDYEVELSVPVSTFITFLGTTLGASVSEADLRQNPARYSGTVESIKIDFEPSDDGDSDPATAYTTSVSLSRPIEELPDVDWPKPDKTSPFTPIQVPFSPVSHEGWRLGYAVIKSPITMATTMRNTYVKEVGSLRSKNSIKTTQGQSYESYNLTYVAKGTYEIEKYIKEVIEQISINPFVCCEGEAFGRGIDPGFIPSKELAIRSFSISTIPQNPDAIMMQIQADPFLWNHWMPPTEAQGDSWEKVELDDAICYPLYKLWCKEAAKSTFNPEIHLNGILNIYKPTKEALIRIENSVQASPIEITQQAQLPDALSELYKGNLQNVDSDIVKEISTLNDDRYFIVKVQDTKLFSLLTGYEKVNGSYVLTQNKPLFAGLMNWDRLNYRFADQYGKRISAGSLIDQSGFPDAAKSLTKNAFNVEDFVDVLRTGNLYQGIYDDQYAHYSEILSKSLSGTALIDEIERLAAKDSDFFEANPTQKYAIVLRVKPGQQVEFNNMLSDLRKITDTTIFNTDPVENYNTILRDSGEELLLGVSDTEDESDIVIEQISASKAHNLAANSVKSSPLPIHQYLGSLGTTMTIRGTCFGLQAKQKLEFVKNIFDHQALRKQSAQKSPHYATNEIESEKLGKVSPFLRLENEISDLMGMKFVMPVTLSFETLDGQPNAYGFELTLIDYDPSLKKEEKLKLIPTYSQSTETTSMHFANPAKNTTHPIMLKALDYFTIQGALKSYQAYPDLELPTLSKVNYWIKEIKEIATIKKTEPEKVLTPEQTKIWEVIRQFFSPYWPENQELMSNWKTDKLEGGFYSDPDFYVYYGALDSFGNLLDRIATQTLGQRVALSGDPATVEGSMRFIEPDIGITSVVDSQYMNAAASTAQSHIEALIENTYNSHNGQPAPEVAQLENQIAQERIDKGGSIGWWVSGLQVIEVGELKVTPISSKLLNNYYDAIIPFDATAEGDKLKDGVQETDFLISEFNSEFQDFFKVRWRLQQVLSFAASGRENAEKTTYGPRDLSKGNFLLPVGDSDAEAWYKFNLEPFRGGSAELVYYMPQGNFNYPYDGKTIALNSIDKYATYVKRSLPGRKKFLDRSDFRNGYDDINNLNPMRFTGVNISLKKPYNSFTGGFAEPLLYRTMSYLERVARHNATFHKSAQGDVRRPAWVDGEEITQIAFDNIDFFHWFGVKYGIDPSYIISYYIVRSGLGTFTSKDNSILSGWGDIDIERLDLSKGPIDAVSAFCKEFRANLDRYKSPTLAIIATDIKLTDKYSRVDLTEMDEVLELASKATRDNQVEAFRSALRQLNVPGELYDLYYVAWVEVNRVMGTLISPYLTSESDIYYGIQNPYIVLDIGRNLNGRAFSTSETPSGTPQLIRAARDLLSTSLYNTLQNGERDNDRLEPNVSAETQLLLNGRQREALTPTSEDAVWGSLLDLRRYTPYGRMIGAYPSYVLIITNEGYFWRGGAERLWDQFYTRTAVSSIEVFRSRKDPASTATVSFSNVFHLLTRYTAFEAFLQNQAVLNKGRLINILKNPISSISDAWTEFIAKEVTDDLKKIWKSNYLNTFILTPGGRLHIRMGYGSDASALPIVFNGTIVETPVGDDVVNIVAVGDGHELNKNSVNKLQQTQNGWVYKDGGPVFGTGKSPSNIITDALINVDGVEAFLSKLTRGSLVGRDFSHGIAHFGDVYFDGFVHYPTEVQINIYDSNLTTLEQGIPAVQELYRAMAFYTWNRSEDNWFSVSVKDATPWKIIHTCRRACMDFVASAEPIMMQSTVFFGKWWWPFNYVWNPRILESNLTNRFQVQRALNNPIELKYEIDEFLGHEDEFTDGLVLSDPFNPAPSLREIEGLARSNVSNDQRARAASRKVIERHLGTVPDVLGSSGRLKSYIADLLKKNKVYSLASFESDILEGFESFYDNPALTIKPGFDEYTRYFYFATGPLDSTAPDSLRKVKVTVITSSLGTTPSNEKAYREMILPDPYSYATYFLPSSRDVGRILNTFGAGELTETLLPYNENTYRKIETIESERLNLGNPNQDQLDTFKDVDYVVGLMDWKPFTQFYIVNSYLNIISSNIEASADQVYTDAIGIHTYNGWMSSDAIEKTSSWCIDDDIIPSSRKTMLVDTGLYVTALQGSWKNLAKRFTGNASVLANVFFPGFNEFIGGTPPTPGVENSVVQSLVDSVKEMYQGWITVTGLPSIKPHDIMTFSDANLGLSGPLGVKEVIHRLDAQTGFITMISPDCVAVPQTCFQGSRILTAVHANTLGQVAALWGAKQFWTIIRHGMDKIFNSEPAERLFKQMVVDQARKLLTDSPIEDDRALQRLGAVRAALDRAELYHSNSQESALAIRKIRDAFAKLDPSSSSYPNDVKVIFAGIEDLQIKQLIPKELVEIFADAIKGDPLSLAGARGNLFRAIREHEEYLIRWRETILDDAKSAGLLDEKTAGSTRIALEDLEAKEWEKFYDQNKELFEHAKMDKVVGSDITNVLNTKKDEALKALAELGTDLYQIYGDDYVNLPEYKALAQEVKDLEDILDDTKIASNKIITAQDIKVLKQYVKAGLGKFWSPTIKDPKLYQELLDNQKAYGRILGGIGSVSGRAIEDISNALINLLSRKKKADETAVDISTPGKLKGSFSRMKDVLKEVGKGIKGVKAGEEASEAFKGVKAAAGLTDDAVKASTIINKAGAGTRKAINVAKLAGYSNPATAVVSLFKDVLMIAFGSSIVDSFNNMTKARQVAKIYPLMNNGIPFTAGVRGHQGLIVGEDPGWLDREIAKWLGGVPVPGQPTEGAWIATSMIASFFDIEVPDFSQNPADLQYIKSIEQHDISE